MSVVRDTEIEESAAGQPTFINKHHTESIFNRYKLLREKAILTDAVIVCKNGERLNVHRFVMAGTSEYFFCNLLNADEHDNVVTLTINMDSKTIETIVNFCYSGVAELTSDNVGDVLSGAKTLGIESLRMFCVEMLDKTLNTENCIRFLEIADVHQLGMLRENALAMITSAFPNVSHLPELFKLSDQQWVWIAQKMLGDQDELFHSLLDALNALNVDEDNRSVVRVSFIAGFLLGHKVNPSPSQETQNRCDEDDDSMSESGCASQNESQSEAEVDCNFNFNFEIEQQLEPVHVLAVFKRNSIAFNQLCGRRSKWVKSSGSIEVTTGIESFRDAVLIPLDGQIAIFHMENGSVSQAQCLKLNNMDVESIALPHDCANWTSLCRTRDKILCFSSDQQNFVGYNLESKLWSRGSIENVKLAKLIVGRKDELFFLGCGFMRTFVRSYDLRKNEWTDRGNLRHECKVTCFKGIAMNDNTIYVVVTRYDSKKIYHGTEFIVQRFDDDNQEWAIVRRFYYSQYVQHFNLTVAENCLYIFYGDGEVEIYHEDLNEWQKGPAIEYGVLDVAMCMIASNSKELMCSKQTF